MTGTLQFNCNMRLNLNLKSVNIVFCLLKVEVLTYVLVLNIWTLKMSKKLYTMFKLCTMLDAMVFQNVSQYKNNGSFIYEPVQTLI